MEYTETGLIQHTPATVLCCNCGQAMDGTKGLTMCYDCIRLTTDITAGLPREATVQFCRNCERFLQPPQQWMPAEPESRELLAILLRRLKGLAKVRLTDAKFIWTEPHSRRIRISLTVQGEAQPTVIVQQTFEVEFVVVATQCPDCARSFTVNTWRAAVQIRQKVPHKRTFFYLEQLILKHNAHVDTVSIRESRDGIDFYYAVRNHAQRMIDFLQVAVPMRYKRSEELISQDTHTGTKAFKFTFSVEIVPICRDDLVVLPKALAHSLGNISPVVLCSRIQSSLQFLDPNTLQTCEVPPTVYWRTPFPSLCDSSELVNFVVLDVTPLGPVRGKWALADCAIARDGAFDNQYVVRTHLGGILHPGDDVLGYFLTNSNFNNDHWETLGHGERPDVVLVKKHYRRRRKPGNRNWKLRRMAKEQEDDVAAGRSAQADRERVERDYELFLQELEEDQELRGTINLYKASNSAGPATAPAPDDSMADDEDEEDGPTINVDELLDDLEGMTIE